LGGGTGGPYCPKTEEEGKERLLLPGTSAKRATGGWLSYGDGKKGGKKKGDALLSLYGKFQFPWTFRN